MVKFGAHWNMTDQERSIKETLSLKLRQSEIPDNELLSNLSLFMTRQDFSHLLFFNHIYQLQLNVHGSIIEFGCRWGRNLALFHHLRGIYEPFNWNRKIIGFDTFKGFLNVSDKDKRFKQGGFSVSPECEENLNDILNLHEADSPISHMKKYEIVKGDVIKTFPEYLKNHPELIVSLVNLDVDLYEPTKACLELVLSCMPKGGIIAFDQLNCDQYPGETIAMKKTMALFTNEIRHTQYSPTQSFVII